MVVLLINELDTRMADLKKTEFEGKTEEYFRIWIVNLFLSIITLGIYSPWAKVVNTKYLYQNLSIEGHRFDYIAEPIQILKGRIIAVFLLILVAVLSAYFPAVYMVSLIILFLLFPWILNRSLSFQLRMTTYRNVSFDFKGDYGNSFWYFLFLPFLSIFTLYLALPAVLRRASEYQINKTKFGNRYFKSSLLSSEYYVAFFTLMGYLLGVGIVIGILTTVTSANFPVLSVLFLVVGYILIIALSASVWGTIIRNHTFNNSSIPKVASFQSTMEIKPYTGIVFTNVLALVFSLGLAYPWVAIRNMKYLSSTLEVQTEEDIDAVINTIKEENSAVLDEVAGAFDIEI
jgi:uncharacterized membrane protein YjgN (DUF898 family)